MRNSCQLGRRNPPVHHPHYTVFRTWFERLPVKVWRAFLRASEEKRSGHAAIDEAQDLLEEGREQLVEVQDILTRGSGDTIEFSE